MERWGNREMGRERNFNSYPKTPKPQNPKTPLSFEMISIFNDVT
jgi:hypothetical protein